MEKTTKKIDIWSIFIYLIIYSIAGFLIETIFGIFTKGVVESRKSFLYGPFCAVYGVGAITMILILRNQKNTFKLFVSGAIIGAAVEYGMSFFCEIFFGVKWWDYSQMLLNINGRTCLFYAISWGILAIILIKFINPYIDKLIIVLRRKNKLFKVATTLIIAFFTIDACFTAYALKIFYYRVSIENDLNVEKKEMLKEKYAQICLYNDFSNFINNYYSDEKMIKTYPNIMIAEKNDNIIYVESLLDDVESYYYRLGDAF